MNNGRMMTQAPSAADCPPAAVASPAQYSISALAQEFDLTTRAIRFYEDMGLLQPRREGAGGRIRVYSARDRTRLKLTLRAKRLGLSLNEAREILDLYDGPRTSVAQLERFLQVLAGHRQQLEERLLELRATLDEVCEQENEARALLRRALDGEVAPDKPHEARRAPVRIIPGGS